ncbi:MAG TPA: ferritin family protein, partial [bacterium]|nr:ferritin family protein [bacterium]
MPDALDAALEKAVDNEIHVRDFYLGSIAKVSSQLARDILQFLADQEVRHMEDIKAYQRKRVGETDAFVLSERITLTTRKAAKSFFGSHRKEFEGTMKTDPDAAGIFDLGKDMEKNGYDYYQQQAERTQDTDARAFFTFLAEEETYHYEL